MTNLLPAFDDPTPTADKRVTAWLKTRRPVDFTKPPEPVELPALDVPRLQRKYGPERAHHPQRKTGTFRVPLKCPTPIYEAIRKQMLSRWLEALSKQGWEPVVDAQHRFVVTPGVYPAHDLGADNIALLDQREMLINGWFRLRNPQPIRLELPPHLLEPLALRGR